MSQNIQKVALHNILLQKRADILHLFVFMVVFVAILNLFANTTPIPNTMPNFKNLSPSARLFLILGYSFLAIRPISDILGCSHFATHFQLLSLIPSLIKNPSRVPAVSEIIHLCGYNRGMISPEVKKPW